MAILNGQWVATQELGLTQQIGDTSTTQNYEVGKKIRARDQGTTRYGEAEFQYAKGVVNTVQGSSAILEYDGTTTLTVARSKGPVGIAMSANVANQWGWYQVTGRGVAKCATVVANSVPYATAAAGVIDDAVVAGDIVYGMKIGTADDTGQCQVSMNYPNLNDTDNA